MHFLRRLNLCDRLAPKYHKFTQYFGLVQNSRFVTWVHRFIGLPGGEKGMGRDFRRGEVAHHSLLKRLPIVWFSLSLHTSPVSRIEPWPICRRSSMPFGMSLAIRISWPNASRGTKGKQCHGFSLVENPSLSHVWEKSLKKGSNRLTKVTLIAQIWYVICDVNCHHTHTFCMLASSIKFYITL